MLNKEGAVIEGLPVSLVPEGLLAAVRLLVVAVQRGEASKGAHKRGFLPLWMAWCLTRCERYLKLLSHISHVWALSPSVFLSWVPTYHTSGRLLLWRLSSVFCVIVSPGKGSSQGSLTCPHAQGLLYRPVLEDYPPTSFQMLLLQLLQLEMFSPLQSPAYTKAQGLSLGPAGQGAALPVSSGLLGGKGSSGGRAAGPVAPEAAPASQRPFRTGSPGGRRSALP